VIIERESRKIIAVRQDKGSVHDFSLYKKIVGSDVIASIGIDGTLGILDRYAASEQPDTEGGEHVS
jgi:hypothetical protein